MNREKFNAKVKYDNFFDDVFFSKEFKNALIKEFGYAPYGMTFDTCFLDDSEIYFKLVSKSYGYEYSGEHVIGDYTLNKFNFTENIFNFTINYIKSNYLDFWEDVKEYTFIY